jgi:SAM-dependent methyltransferase
MTTQHQTQTPAEAYEEYFGPAIFTPFARKLVDQAAPRPGERVLDLACGTGIVARHVAPLVGAQGTVVGVDVNPAMVAVAQRHPPARGASIEWREGDALDLDLGDETFDLVLCQHGLQFFPDRAAGIRETRRVLSDGGRAVVAVWRGLDHHPLYAALIEAELPHLSAFDDTVTRADLEAPFSMGDADLLRALLADGGFADVDVVERSIEARFATPERFVERMEFAYAAVIPAFAEDPATFAAYLDIINRHMSDTVEAYREGDQVVVSMHALIAVGHRA